MYILRHLFCSITQQLIMHSYIASSIISFIYLAAVFGISFPGIPSAIITFIFLDKAYSLSIPPGFDAKSIINISLSNESIFFESITLEGTVFINISNLFPQFFYFTIS